MRLELINKQLSFQLLLLILALPVSKTTQAQSASDLASYPKVAVVLSGGGAKGFAHVGVLKVLEEEGIPIDIIVGTSIGSLIGGFYSIGYSADEIQKIIEKQDWEAILSDDVPRLCLSENDKVLSQRYLFSLPYSDEKKLSLPMGMIKGQNVMNLFCGLAGNVPADADFTKLPVSFACVAANLETGREVVMKNGFLPSAMYSSMAIPGAFGPSKRDGMILVDGGVVNNFPVDVAKEMGADIIIGVDIRGGFYTRDEIKSMGKILGQMINFLGMEKDAANSGICDLIIRPDIAGYSVSSFTGEAADTLFLRGKKAAGLVRDQLSEMKEKYQLKPREKSRAFIAPEEWEINDLNLTGAKQMNESFLLKRFNLPVPGSYSYEEIKDAIDRLYGYGGFDKIYFTLNEHASGGKTLELTITTEKEFSMNIGFKVNTTDAAALLLNLTRKNYSNTLGLLSASVELSANPGFSLMAETNKNDFPALGTEIKGKYQNYDIYEKGDKLMNADLFYASGSIYLYQSFLRWYHIGFGLQEEYFNGDVFTKGNTFSPVSSAQIDRFNTNVYSYFSVDNMDNFYFPVKGTNLYAEFSLNADFKNENVNSALLFKMKNVIPLWHNTVLLCNLYGRALFSPEYLMVKTTFIGGDSYSQYFSYHLPFYGLPPVVVADRYSAIGLLGLRLKLPKSQYVSFMFNLLQQGSSPADWAEANTVYGGGIKYSVKTMIGPMDIGMGYSNLSDELSFSANLGYWF
ncbi:patatin-like phospholipase family protein [Gaoshiqia sp. Z1-71]|uniref:patatin-like phospholipase family protein n=1 Tax=Gaoshiqia hydrogeniformans TaxID=3290090 RepID=UPI003BF7AB21